MKLTQAVVFIYTFAAAFGERHRRSPQTSTGFEELSAGHEQAESPDVHGAVAFSVARSRPLKGHQQTQAGLSFDHVFFNVGRYFEPQTGVFTAPSGGVYEFAFSGGALPHKKLSLQLMKNHYEVQTLAYDGHRKKNPSTQNQQILLELEGGDRVWLRLAASRSYGIVGSPANGYVTTFTGHRIRETSRDDDITMGLDGISLTSVELPSSDLRHRDVTGERRRSRRKRLASRRPQSSSNAVAFSVAKTTSVIGRDVNRTRHEPSTDGILTYDKVFVNVDDVMNPHTGQFTAPTGGLYYFSFTVGKYPKKKLSVSLLKNNNEFQVMVYDEGLSNRREMQSQSVILHLQAEDVIWLKSYNREGYGVYSNFGNYITFNGYLLQSL